MKIGNKVLTLVNIYAPNNDNPTFFQNVLGHLLSFECEKNIMGGDFNLVRTFRGIKKEETQKRIEIRLKKSRT